MNEEENRAEDAEALEAAGLRLHVTRVRRRGRRRCRARRARPARSAYSGLPAPGSRRTPRAEASEGRRAFVPIWRRPWMTLNRRHLRLLVARGARVVANVYADARRPLPDGDARGGRGARARRGARAHRSPTRSRRGMWRSSRQVAPVELVDGQDLFWWGGRTASALRTLARGDAAHSPCFVVAALAVAAAVTMTGGGGRRRARHLAAGRGAPDAGRDGRAGRRSRATDRPRATGFIADAAAACDLVTGDDEARARLVGGPARGPGLHPALRWPAGGAGERAPRGSARRRHRDPRRRLRRRRLVVAPTAVGPARLALDVRAAAHGGVHVASPRRRRPRAPARPRSLRSRRP